MKQLTVRGLDAELERRLRETARREGESLTKAALRLLRRGAGIEDRSGHQGAIGASLDAHFGTWTEEEAAAFDAAVADFEEIDDELWQ